MLIRNLIYKKDLIFDLVKRDLKLNYRRSFLGLLWAQINPLFSLLIFSFVFQKIVPLNIPNYTAYVFVGLLTWNWFSNSLNNANYSLIFSRDLVRKPQFQTEMIIAASVGTNLANFLLALPILLGLLIFSNLIPNWTIIFLPVLILIQYCFTLGLALIISSLNVFFRDISHITSIILIGWFYLTPVFYKPNLTPEFAYFSTLNPMFQFLDLYRTVLIEGKVPEFFPLLILFLLSSLVLSFGYLVFQRLKPNFVDEL
jgi:ABC-type polysaccharide/polyol phosphate export permease